MTHGHRRHGPRGRARLRRPAHPLDAQVLFDPYVYPSIEHGVTTVVTGNCSLSMAPVRPEHRDRFSRMFRLIEEMPEGRVRTGRRLALGRWVRGDGRRGRRRRRAERRAAGGPLGDPPVRDGRRRSPRRHRRRDRRRCATCCATCLDAGAVGLSTSYVDVEDDMLPVPCRFAEHRELEALCAVLGERDRMLQIVHEFFDTDLTVSRVEMLGDLSRRFGIPTTLSPLFHSGRRPTATDTVMAAVDRECANGARVWPQVQTRPIDISWTLDQRSIMFLVIPGWWKVLSMPIEGRQARGARRSRRPAPCWSTGLDALSHVARIGVRRRELRHPPGRAR